MTKSVRNGISSFEVRHYFVIRHSSFVIKFTPLFRQSLPYGCARHALQAARTLSHPRSCLFWRQPPPRSQPFPPCRPPLLLPLSLWAGNRPYIRSRDKFPCAPFAGRNL